MTFRLQSYNFNFKIVKSEENVCDYSSRHPYKDLLNFKKLVHYVNFVAYDATANALTIDIIKKFTKNDKLLHQAIKIARNNNCYKISKPLIFLEYIENHNNFKHFLKADSELAVDNDLVLKSNRIVIPSDFQNYIFPLAREGCLAIVKTK